MNPGPPAPAITVIINPISGTAGRADVAQARARLAVERLVAQGFEPDVFLTERQGHARELARMAIDRGVKTVVAWGGDGTMNEVASALAFGGASLAIVPSGSGNGLARELAIPFDPARALEVAVGPGERMIDVGEIDGHLFFNVAGVGLDARVAHRFAVGGLARRGFARYLGTTLRELSGFGPDDLVIVADGERTRDRPLIVAIANGRQYGNGAMIAPHARLDDGRLDVVVVASRSPLRILLMIPRVFMGQLGRAAGVTMRTATRVEITSTTPVAFHADGEPFVGGPTVEVSIHPKALRIKVPATR